MNGGEKLANYQPTDFSFSPGDGHLTYLHAASHQVGVRRERESREPPV